MRAIGFHHTYQEKEGAVFDFSVDRICKYLEKASCMCDKQREREREREGEVGRGEWEVRESMLSKKSRGKAFLSSQRMDPTAWLS